MTMGDRSSHGVAALVAGLLLVASWYGFGQFEQAEASREARLHLILEGRHYRVPESRLPALRARSGIWFRQGAVLAGARLDRQLEERVDALFQPVEARVPDFLDWYYSLRGEYTRLGGWALEKLGYEGRAMVVGKTDELLFEATHFRERLAGLKRRFSGEISHVATQTRSGWRRMMQAALSDYEVPPPLEGRSGIGPAPVELGAFTEGAVRRQERARLENRLMLSSAGGLATGALVWRAATRAAVSSGGRAVAARSAGRVASRAGSAALAGMGLCGVAGPVAIGCGVVAGTAAWISIDWAMIEADEWANRDDLEQHLRQGLDNVRRDLRKDLARALKDRLEQLNRAERVRIQKTLTPLDTIKKAATQGGGQTEHG